MPGSRPIVRTISAVGLCLIIFILCIGTGTFALGSTSSASDQTNAATNPSDNSVVRPTPNLLEAAPNQIGQAATDFALFDLAGQQVWLSDYRGKLVIVTFWATWCPPCQAEIPGLNNLYHDLKAKGVEILAVDVMEAPGVVNDFVTNMGMSYPVLLDARGNLVYAYGVHGIPTSFFIDRQGILRDIRMGGVDEATIRSIIASIDS